MLYLNLTCRTCLHADLHNFASNLQVLQVRKFKKTIFQVLFWQAVWKCTSFLDVRFQWKESAKEYQYAHVGEEITRTTRSEPLHVFTGIARWVDFFTEASAPWNLQRATMLVTQDWPGGGALPVWHQSWQTCARSAPLPAPPEAPQRSYIAANSILQRIALRRRRLAKLRACLAQEAWIRGGTLDWPDNLRDLSVEHHGWALSFGESTVTPAAAETSSTASGHKGERKAFQYLLPTIPRGCQPNSFCRVDAWLLLGNNQHIPSESKCEVDANANGI